jgi:hypothetical protein
VVSTTRPRVSVLVKHGESRIIKSLAALGQDSTVCELEIADASVATSRGIMPAGESSSRKRKDDGGQGRELGVEHAEFFCVVRLTRRWNR